MASRQQNDLQIVREGYDSFNAGDFETTMERFDQDIEWVVPEGVRYGGTYHGHDEVGGFFERVSSDIEDLHLEPDRFIDSGETVVVLGNARGTAGETGDPLDIQFVHVLDLEDGKITRFQEFSDTAQMEQALGA